MNKQAKKTGFRAVEMARFLTLGQQVLAGAMVPAHATVGAFDNNREQGFCIRVGEVHFAFSENRSSDDVVVYEGRDFDPETGCPTRDADWQGRKLFRTADAAIAHLNKRIAAVA